MHVFGGHCYCCLILCNSVEQWTRKQGSCTLCYDQCGAVLRPTALLYRLRTFAKPNQRLSVCSAFLFGTLPCGFMGFPNSVYILAKAACKARERTDVHAEELRNEVQSSWLQNWRSVIQSSGSAISLSERCEYVYSSCAIRRIQACQPPIMRGCASVAYATRVLWSLEQQRPP